MKKLVLFNSIHLMFVFYASAQGTQKQAPLIHNVSNYKSLTVGDKCPNTKVTMLNYFKESAMLSDFKGKVVILDFWTQWCTDCIRAMSKIEALQKKFNNEIQILPITYSDKASVESFWKKSNYLKRLKFPMIVEDEELHRAFPHKSVPHLVWIDKDQFIRGITFSDYLTEDNIVNFINNKIPKWHLKKDITNFNYNENLLKTSFVSSDNTKNTYYSSVLPYVHGAESQEGLFYDTLKGQLRYYRTNTSIINLYKTCLKNKPHLLYKNRFILKVPDTSIFIFPKNSSYWDAWQVNNHYCYESVLPISTSNAKLLEMMLYDLNRYFQLNGRIEAQKRKCLTLKVSDTCLMNQVLNERIGDSNTRHFKFISSSDLVDHLNQVSLSLPVIQMDTITFPSPILLSHSNNLNVLKAELTKCGITLVEGTQVIETFILSY